MKGIHFPALFFFIFIIACHSGSEKEQSANHSSGLKQISEDFYEQYLKLNPITATSLGDNRYNDTIPNNISTTFRQKEESFYSEYKTKLEEIDRDQLSEDDKVNYDVLLWECNINLERLQFPQHLTPINQFYSFPNTMGSMASGKGIQPFETVEDYDNWLKRVDDYLAWCDTAIANMKKGIEKGYVLPKALSEKVIPQLAAHADGPVENHLFYQPANNIPESFSAEDKKMISEKYMFMVQDKVIPKYKELVTFFKDTYLAQSRETAGILYIPDGEDYYKHQIKTYTTLDLSADSVFNLGMSEVERITAEMEKVKEEVGFDGDIKAFFEHVRTLPALMPYTDPQQVLDHFEEIHERMKPQLSELFDNVPKADFEVRRTEAFREKSASAEYRSPSLDGSRPGVFYVPIPDVGSYNIFSDEDLFLHEAIPGHHYQIALQQENDSLPDFRKVIWYSAYGEGWALYTESLGEELGLYEDPYQYFGMLSAEMHRAIRLVVDAGMHSKGWTREQAIQFSLDHEAESEESIIAEIERYMSWPGQALSYKIGQLKIMELREKAKQKMGENFDIKEFHNQVLETGSVPLAVLEAKINRWIEGN